MVPRQPLVVGEPPVGNPVEPGRIDVGQRTFLEPVQLVGPDEVHLPDEHGAVAEQAQPVRERRDARRQLAGIVDRPGARRQETAHQRRPGRHAERRRAERAFEDDPFAGETVEVRSKRDAVAVGRERGGGELVRHNEDDGRLVHIVHCVRLSCTR